MKCKVTTIHIDSIRRESAYLFANSYSLYNDTGGIIAPAAGMVIAHQGPEARHRHDMLAAASVVLGRSITAGVILGAMLKGEEKLTIKMNGGGSIGSILVDANAWKHSTAKLSDSMMD